jgi:2'-hydroxyisoflavone reductase
MKILVLGGTVFVGRAFVDAAQARGHEITLFNRGTHGADLFPDVEQLRGDRTLDLSPLKGRQWDAVLDTCGYVPRVVRASAELLAGAVGHYTFISTGSVYEEFGAMPFTETSGLAVMTDPTVEEITNETYGPLKAACEQAVETTLPGRTLVIRPGLIVGPHDPTDRFTYWPTRVAKGGEVLAPNLPGRKGQVLDVRDLGEWTLRLIEAGTTGLYNACGPAEPYRLGDLLDMCERVSGSGATFTWVTEDFLLGQEVTPWMEIPLWLPATDFLMDIDKALAAGLTHRPLAVTVADTLAWQTDRPSDYEWKAGLKPERERVLLEAWHNLQTE